MSAQDFFTDTQQRSIGLAIENAEKNTSGEVRVHIESHCKGSAKVRAIEVFEKLKMHQTELRNGVLFYLAVADKQFAVIGDQGIHDHVGEEFWNEVRDVMAIEFKKNEFTVGLCQGIELAGLKLKHHFPYQKDDINELTNDISFDE